MYRIFIYEVGFGYCFKLSLEFFLFGRKVFELGWRRRRRWGEEVSEEVVGFFFVRVI